MLVVHLIAINCLTCNLLHASVIENLKEEHHAKRNVLDNGRTRRPAALAQEEFYHKEPHSGLDGLTPLERYRKDLIQIRPLGPFATRLDELFLHRHDRLVRKDGTVLYLGERFEVPYELVGKTVKLAVHPHREKVIGVESENGGSLGKAILLDPLVNCHHTSRATTPCAAPPRGRTGANLVEIALARQTRSLCGGEPLLIEEA